VSCFFNGNSVFAAGDEILSEIIHIEGIIEEIIYQNEENGYTVCEIYGGEANGYFTATGTMPYVTEGIGILVTGQWIINPLYGEQFRVDFYELVMPSDEEAMEIYLSSGVIPGIGEATAKKLVNKFGKDIFTVILTEHERLAEIKGISLKKAQTISKDFAKVQAMQNVIMFLQKYNVSVNTATMVYKILGSNAVDIIKENPYILAERIQGISFKTADSIAFTMEIPKTNPDRLKSGIKYYLMLAAFSDGHTYLPKNVLIEHCTYHLDVSEEEIENTITMLLADKSIAKDDADGTDCYYLSSFYNAEIFVAKTLLYLSEHSKKDISKEKIDTLVKNAEKYSGIELANEQKNAVEMAISSGVMVLTGGPGTGKTTAINAIINVMRENGYKIALTAPTGRAAKRMSEVTGMEALTIHRFLKMSRGSDGHNQIFEHDEKNPVDADVIIVDETSMVDIMLINSLLKAVKPGTKLIFSGDADQLPSVGAGNVLHDMIKSGVVATVKLEKIFRQAEESLIVVNAHKINNGEMPELKCRNKDFFFMSRNSAVDIKSTIADLCRRRLPASYGIDPITNIQVLSPMKKGNAGVIELNTVLQRELNPPKENKKEHKHANICFREGDKVMQMKNNYDIEWRNNDDESGFGIFNGDMGIIEEIDNEDKTMTIMFDDTRRVIYSFSDLDELDLSYAVTVHKSQGSEFPIVIMPMYNFAPMLMYRNLLYTAVTRAKSMVILVGSEKAVVKMVKNNELKKRYTSLAERMRNFAKAFGEQSDLLEFCDVTDGSEDNPFELLD